MPDEGRLTLRAAMVSRISSTRPPPRTPGIEELAYLLIAGDLPSGPSSTASMLPSTAIVDLPNGFVNNLIMNYPSENVMNMMARSVLMLYAADGADEIDAINERHGRSRSPSSS